MFNIQKQGSSLLITSSDNTQFPYKDGKMSIPMNSITYVIDESNYIAFRSAANNDILFSANINEIQINGSTVGKDDFIMMFDSVANSTASGGGGSASAGVNSINGFQGDLTLKSVNGKNLIGSGNIEIEGGVTSVNGATGDVTIDIPENYITEVSYKGNNIITIDKDNNVTTAVSLATINGQSLIGGGNIEIEGGGSSSGVNKIIMGEEDYGWNTYQGNVKLNVQLNAFDDGSAFYDVRIGDNNGDSMWFGFTSSDKSIKIGEYSSRIDFKINEWVGTQDEYDSLGEYDSNCTYYITE